MITDTQWSAARRIARRALATSLHSSIASVDADGTPHVTPIGSLVLGGKGSAIYFDVFNSRLATNVDRDPHISILLIDSGRLMWLRSLISGTFVSPPGMRLLGRAGAPRPSSDQEVALLRRIIGPFGRTRGGVQMWGSLATVRDIEISRIQSLNMGSMTRRIGG